MATTTRSRARKPAPKLPDNVRLALRRYFPTEISARSAAYYALPEHLALLRLRSEAESRMLRWNDVAEDLQRELPDLALRASECTAFSNSYELEILLHENAAFPDKAENLTDVVKRGPMRTAHLAASFLLPYWNLQFRKWRKSRLGAISIENVPQEGRHSTRVVNAVAKILKKHGWKRIPPNLAQTKIPGIDLEHVEKGEVRVADVVFGELSDSPF